MKVTNSRSAALDSVTSKADQDRAELLQFGKELQSSEDKYRAAIKKGNEGEIAAAQMDFEKSAQKLKAKVEMNSAINRIINSIIEKIGQVGQ